VAAALAAFVFVRRARAKRSGGQATAVQAPSGPVTTTARRTLLPAPTLAHDATPSHRTSVDSLETLSVPTPTPSRLGGTHVSPANAPFGDFRLVEQLGKGGMASVYKVERRGEVCALKRPLSGFLEDAEFLERFQREAEIGRTLHHPNIIRIFERGEVDGVPYFTMELVEGETLQSHVRRLGALDGRAAAKVVAQVAEALDYAHLKGVVHRDLKPSNIMILRDGTVKVMDYGIARARKFDGLTVTGAFLGTPDYVAPETAEGRPTDARSDLYSLGIVFYEILTGRRPFVAETPFATLKKHCTEPPAPPSTLNAAVPKELEAIVLKLLSKSPDERHPSAEELLIELREYLNRAAA
jgi:serine/threonine protein kinase